MSALITADLHLSANPRDAYRIKRVSEFKDDCRRLGVSQFIALGDLTEEKDEHSAFLTNTVADLFVDLASVMEVIIMLGNHDYRIEDLPFFHFLRHIKNIRFITQPVVTTIKGLGRVGFMPHSRHYTKKDYREISRDTDWVFAHDAFRGAVSESGHKMEHGVDTSWFDAEARVISGDIHKPQKVDCVTYVGAPYTVDFGDDYEPRVLLVNENGMESIDCRGPQKVLIYAEAGPKPWVDLKDTCEGDILKIKVRIRQKHLDQWSEIKKGLEDWARKYKCIPYSVVPDLIKDDSKDAKPLRSITSRKTDKQVMREFADRRQIDDAILKTGLFLMEKSK
jgi:hypothetical protein